MHSPQAFAIAVPKRLCHMYIRVQSQKGEIYLYKIVSGKNVIIPPTLKCTSHKHLLLECQRDSAIYIIRRPLPERERARLLVIPQHLPIMQTPITHYCNTLQASSPADSNQQLQYLAISHSAICNLPILQSAGYWLQDSKRGTTNPPQGPTGRHSPPQAGQPSGSRRPQIHLKSMTTHENQ